MEKSMRFDAFIQQFLSQLPASERAALRQDANETAFFSRQLEHIYSQTYDVQYPEYKARSLIPVDTQPPSGAESHTYEQYDWRGEAKLIRVPSDDAPNVDVFGKEFTNKIVSYGVSYQYSIQDLRAAQMAGRNIDSMRALAARRSMETKLDSLACTGEDSVSMKGLANAANILDVTSDVNGDWLNSATTVDEILEDVNIMQEKIFSTTKGIYTPDTLVVGTKCFAKLATRPQSPTFTEKSLMQYILAQSPWLRAIEYWPRLDTAGASSKERALMYKRSPEVLKMVIPQEFEQLPPQARNMAFVVPCHFRFGGVTVHYPKAVVFADGFEA